ncbi:peptidoglycan DD-metalloendopeptidase family protein [Bacillus sp. IITD106]|nr:peptidoglycan DD-metalloendopeptidase family protein [Bacillus sp. IITD106]
MAATLGFGGIFTSVHGVSAASLDDLQNQQSDIINKRSNVNQSIEEKENKIIEIGDRQSELEAEMKKLEQQIADTDNKITEKQKQIEDTKAEIERLKKEINDLKIRIEKRNELLLERARNIQQNGGSVKLIDVLLGAESFGDFIDRISVVSTLVNADKQIIEEQKADQAKLEENQKKVETELASLNAMLQELENLKADLKNQNDKKAQISKELAAQKKHIESEKMSLEEQDEILKAQAAIVQKAISAEKARIAEEEARIAKQKAEEEARRAREQQQQSSSQDSNTTSSSQGSSSQGSSLGNGNKNGVLNWPAAGRLSSGYGGRPQYGYHLGIDIANSTGTPIYASAAGVVSISHFSPSYGNVVYVYHPQLNLTTVYAHMSQRSVSPGQHVSSGQQLGLMGNTGDSHGSHLHFEVHHGQWSYRGGVNPMPFLK